MRWGWWNRRSRRRRRASDPSDGRSRRRGAGPARPRMEETTPDHAGGAMDARAWTRNRKTDMNDDAQQDEPAGAPGRSIPRQARAHRALRRRPAASSAPRHARRRPPHQGYGFADVVSAGSTEDDAQPRICLRPSACCSPRSKPQAAQGAGPGRPGLVRLEMEQLILEGRISVNNEPAHVGQRVQHGDQVKVNGKPIRYRSTTRRHARVIAYHKPGRSGHPWTTHRTGPPCSESCPA